MDRRQAGHRAGAVEADAGYIAQQARGVAGGGALGRQTLAPHVLAIKTFGAALADDDNGIQSVGLTRCKGDTGHGRQGSRQEFSFHGS
jgi:hypothetical protein